MVKQPFWMVNHKCYVKTRVSDSKTIAIVFDGETNIWMVKQPFVIAKPRFVLAKKNGGKHSFLMAKP